MAVNYMELLDGIELPATRAEIIQYAEDNGASEDALDMMQAMPDEQYYKLEDINQNLLTIREIPGTRTNLYSSSQNS